MNTMKQKLAGNFAHPRGLVGRIAGRIMARKQGNVERGRWAVTELAPGPGDRVLELGYGPGVTLAETCRYVPDGQVVGVDLSDVMRAQATRRNRAAVREGRLDLRVGDAQRLDADLTDFDLIYGINVWQFWSDQSATVAELASRLAPGGRLALVYMQPPMATTTSDQAEDELVEQLRGAGLTDIDVAAMQFDPPAVMVSGTCSRREDVVTHSRRDHHATVS